MKALLSIPALVREVKNIDPESAVNIGMINYLIDEKYQTMYQIKKRPKRKSKKPKNVKNGA